MHGQQNIKKKTQHIVTTFYALNLFNVPCHVHNFWKHNFHTSKRACHITLAWYKLTNCSGCTST